MDRMQAGKLLKNFSGEIGLSEKAFREALPVCFRILEECIDIYAGLRMDPENGELLKVLSERLNLSEDLTCLAFSLLQGVSCREIYEEKKIPEEIWRDGMKEIAIWERTCEKEFGHVGLREYHWVVLFLTAKILRIGRLEFHRIPYEGKEDWKYGDLTVHPGDTVLNIHIPEDGPLLPTDVVSSVQKAYRFFGCSGIQPFVCESWLLYPGFYDFLPKNSNIRAFMDVFDIVEHTDKQNDGDLWRVFGHRESYIPSELPKNTSFQRGLAKYLEEHDNVTGWGMGIFVCDGEKLMK